MYRQVSLTKELPRDSYYKQSERQQLLRRGGRFRTIIRLRVLDPNSQAAKGVGRLLHENAESRSQHQLAGPRH